MLLIPFSVLDGMFFKNYAMKKIVVLIAIVSSLMVQAQNDSISAKAEFKLSVNYNSNLNYYGRTDSLKSTGFFPMAEIWFSPKFYINAAPVFVNNKLQSFEYAGTVATAGFQNLTEKWLTNLYVLKPFYKESSQLVQSALKAQAGINISSLNKIANITVGGDVKFSDKTDFGATAGLDHIIRMDNKDGSAFVIDPSFYAYAGTQNFTNTYYKKKAGLPFFPGTNEQVTETVQQFTILAYEASVPLIYVKDKWMVLATPSYILPQNLITVPNRPDLSERGENTFYITLALKRTF
jgi:hypothetical protein